MRVEAHYLKFVRWSDEDSVHVGYCPDLFFGGVCHGTDEGHVYKRLKALVREEINDLLAAGKEPPAPATRPMREAVGA